MSSNELFERAVELAAECRDYGMGGGEFVSTVAYSVMDLIETALTEGYKERALCD